MATRPFNVVGKDKEVGRRMLLANETNGRCIVVEGAKSEVRKVGGMQVVTPANMDKGAVGRSGNQAADGLCRRRERQLAERKIVDGTSEKTALLAVVVDEQTVVALVVVNVRKEMEFAQQFDPKHKCMNKERNPRQTYVEALSEQGPTMAFQTSRVEVEPNTFAPIVKQLAIAAILKELVTKSAFQTNDFHAFREISVRKVSAFLLFGDKMYPKSFQKIR